MRNVSEHIQNCYIKRFVPISQVKTVTLFINVIDYLVLRSFLVDAKQFFQLLRECYLKKKLEYFQ